MYRGKGMKTVDVLLTGQIVQGTDVQTSAASLARMAGIDQRVALQMLSAGRLIRIKKGVEATVGLQYFRALRAIGVEVLLRPTEPAPAGQAVFPARQVVNRTEVRRFCTSNPGTQSVTLQQAGREMEALPRLGPGYPSPSAPVPVPATYPANKTAEPGVLRQALAAAGAVSTKLAPFPLQRDSRRVAIALPHGPKSRRSDDWLTTPRRVSASQGWEWLRQAWMQFTDQFGLWLLCFFLCCCMLSLLFWIPAVHIFLMVMVLPILLGALMLVAHRQHLEEPLGSLQPLAAALQRGQGLLLLGFFSLLFLLFLGAACIFAADFGLLSRSIFTLPGLHLPNPAQMQAMAAGIVFLLLLLLMLAGYLFAIPLILFARLRPLHGFQMGVYGCIKNWRAILITLTITASCLSSTLALLLALQQYLPWLPGFMYAALIAVAVVLVFIIGILFIYSAFRDIFAISP